MRHCIKLTIVDAVLDEYVRITEPQLWKECLERKENKCGRVYPYHYLTKAEHARLHINDLEDMCMEVVQEFFETMVIAQLAVSVLKDRKDS